tara:strand:+ start:147 stop:536 length:390 start_codon:yes stop_codon:yes gene_type:complete
MARQTFTSGQVLTAAEMSQVDANAGWNLDYNAQTGTTYTLVLTDAGKLVTLNNASAIALTVPTNASVAFAVGDQINLLQLGAGQVTVAGDAGVTVSSEGAKLKLKAQYAIGTLVKTGTDGWVLVGNLAA